ncbi:MarR family winged helix-turn-helix transcriptional regulator [Chitinophaga sp. XS-30]|uniref:MarR family winged helix-turn-helix transcriptional regulator n=1 Tax=Chitinophaga sp. XS-30 TaxID=2604421 RepID=UPI0011DCBD14|nr:MarR family transcriptional regulator [Chitinophaga sp. XS-30]QEH40824.1 MarR family transcriptional regulator [Chitinophaga sp. XS-30]
MTDTALDKKFHEVLGNRPRLLIRLLSLVKKDIDARLTEKLQLAGYKDFKIGDMVLLANISPEGTINNELAKKARITKQAMSKVVKNLVATGFIYTRKHETDNRATVICLTDKGKQLLIDAYERVEEIQQYYTGIIGEQDTEVLRDILFRLVEEIHPQSIGK